jgi:hypothetical protein
MTPTATDARLRAERLCDILLEHLSRTGVVTWPGVDGLQIEDVLFAYIPAASAGLVPGREELCAGHPELAAELDAFFATVDPHPRVGAHE